ncbi:hypothetical protein AB0M28_29990 [Streptomyces sp. NPDC051940]|uniref:hypothetical protein n=1 Tax=Streptomyces sp. NPDC051940 TaxID=3155675 RepID=UPI00343BE700
MNMTSQELTEEDIAVTHPVVDTVTAERDTDGPTAGLPALRHRPTSSGHDPWKPA